MRSIRFISARLIPVPHVENKLKELHFAYGIEIQIAVTDELMGVQKQEFSAGFQKIYDRSKACM